MTDYPFTERKERGEVVGSLPTHKLQLIHLKEGNDICMYQEEILVLNIPMLTGTNIP